LFSFLLFARVQTQGPWAHEAATLPLEHILKLQTDLLTTVLYFNFLSLSKRKEENPNVYFTFLSYKTEGKHRQ
jgi:hypothetical protein